MMGEIKSYRDLEVWKRSVNLSVLIYKVTERFPRSEVYGLRSQIRRSAVSIPSNISEGHSRSRRDYARFVVIAKGSLSELETQLEIGHRVGYISKEDLVIVSEEMTILGRQLNNLSSRLREQ
jgi:four helix bundle protein